jgi:hypothetical protein
MAAADSSPDELIPTLQFPPEEKPEVFASDVTTVVVVRKSVSRCLTLNIIGGKEICPTKISIKKTGYCDPLYTPFLRAN